MVTNFCAAMSLVALSAAASAKPDGTAIYERMLKLYAGATTYQDHGTIRQVVTEGSRPSRAPRDIRFRTAFTREGGFRFEAESDATADGGAVRDVVWRKGAEMRRRMSGRKEETVIRNLPSMVQAAGFATGSPAGFHPLSLLLPDARFPFAVRKPTITRAPDGKHAGRACYRLQSLDRSMGTAERTLWIDKATYHLLRVDESTSVDLADGPDVTTESHITYRPTFDKPVPAKALALDP